MGHWWAKLLAYLQGRCTHPSSAVTADVLEGDAVKSAIMVRWCRLCGAYARLTLYGATARVGEWVRPHPEWYR